MTNETTARLEDATHDQQPPCSYPACHEQQLDDFLAGVVEYLAEQWAGLEPEMMCGPPGFIVKQNARVRELLSQARALRRVGQPQQPSPREHLLRDVLAHLEAQELRVRIAAVRPGDGELACVRELKQRVEAVVEAEDANDQNEQFRRGWRGAR